MSVEDAITQTANTARVLLFDREGKPIGIDHYYAALTLLLIRPVEWFGQTDNPGLPVFPDGRGGSMIYDADIAEILFSECSHFFPASIAGALPGQASWFRCVRSVGIMPERAVGRVS